MGRKKAALPKGGRSVLARLSPKLASAKPAPGWTKREWSELRSGLVKAQRGERLGVRQRQAINALRESIERAPAKHRPKRLRSLLERKAAPPQDEPKAPAPIERPRLAPEVARGDLPTPFGFLNGTFARNRGFKGGETVEVQDQSGKVLGTLRLPKDLDSREQWRSFFRSGKKLYRKGVKAIWVYV